MSQLKKLTNDKKLWDSFCEYLDEEIELFRKNLEQSNDFGEMKSHQGAIKMARRIKNLRDKVNYEKQSG